MGVQGPLRTQEARQQGQNSAPAWKDDGSMKTHEARQAHCPTRSTLGEEDTISRTRRKRGVYSMKTQEAQDKKASPVPCTITSFRSCSGGGGRGGGRGGEMVVHRTFEKVLFALDF